MENENDLQEVQPDQTEQEVADTTSDEVSELRKQLEERDQRIAELARAKRELKKEVKKNDPQNIEKQSEGFDYGMKAYLRAEGIEPSEFAFVQDQLESSGLKDLDSLIGNGYFQSQLKEHREKVAVKEATPTGSRQASEPPSTRVEYWLAKGEMPPNTPENQALRREFVNRRLELEKKRGQFSDTPIVG